MGHAIRAGDPRLARIDVLMPGFLAREDLAPVELPFHHSLSEVVAPREETASLRLSLEAKIDQFRLKEKEQKPRELVVQVSDSEDEPDRFSSVRTLSLVIAHINDSLEDEEKMALNRKKGLKELFVERNKGTLRPQPLHTLLPPPSPPTVDLLPIPIPNLKKKRKEKEIVEEGEVVSQKESKHQKMAKDKGCPSSIESKEAEHLADMCHPTWNP